MGDNNRANPRFIDIVNTNKKVPYSFRVEERVLDKLHSISGNLDISTAELLTKISKDYLADKTPYNNYLETFNRFIFDLPLNLEVKRMLTSRLGRPDNVNFKGFTDMDLENEIGNIMLDGYQFTSSSQNVMEINKYQVLRVPNNLDTFNNDLETFTSTEKGLKHQGAEFLIAPELAEHTNDYTECLYCFYFTVNDENELKMELINFTDMENMIIEKGNKYLNQLSQTIYYNLEVNCNSKEYVQKLAEMYNTDNIIPFTNKPIEVKPFKVVLRDNVPIIRQYDKELERRVETLYKEFERFKENE